tara:strand:+ start:2282 stop:2608 length:327 start_codon:yes stop_codon:yes gene_type:complete
MKTDKKTETLTAAVEKLKETSSAVEKYLEEAVVVKPDWIPKGKTEEKVKIFSVTLDESTNKINLIVDGEVYREHTCKDNLSGSIKYHESMDAVLRKFSDWSFYDKSEQ